MFFYINTDPMRLHWQNRFSKTKYGGLESDRHYLQWNVVLAELEFTESVGCNLVSNGTQRKRPRNRIQRKQTTSYVITSVRHIDGITFECRKSDDITSILLQPVAK